MLLLLVAIFVLLFLNKTASKVAPTKVGTSNIPPLSQPLTKGGVAQIPQVGDAPPIPPFYQTSNNATPAVPKTSLGFGFSPIRFLGGPISPIPHNNIVINGPLDTSQLIKVPISGAYIADNNVEQIAYENATAYGAGSVAIPISAPQPILAGDAGLPQRTAL